VHCLCQTRNKGHAIKQAGRASLGHVHCSWAAAELLALMEIIKAGYTGVFLLGMRLRHEAERGAESTWIKRKGQDGGQRFDLVLVSAL
jgi:hypothetical protein